MFERSERQQIEHDLGNLLGGNGTVGNGINASGQITGTAVPSNNTTDSHAFLYSGGTSIVDLGTLPGLSTTVGQGINASGQVTGYAVDLNSGNGPYHAFLYGIDTGMVDLGTLPGGSYSISYGINAFGQVVGSSTISSSGFVPHAFLYSAATGMVDLNTVLPAGSGWTLDAAMAINDAGQITGSGKNPNGAAHAFVLTPVDAGHWSVCK